MPTPRKIPCDREREFVAAWADLTVTAPALASRFGVNRATVFATAKRLGLAPRMPDLARHGLPPFGRRRGERAA